MDGPPPWWSEIASAIINLPDQSNLNYKPIKIKDGDGLIHGNFINCEAYTFSKPKHMFKRLTEIGKTSDPKREKAKEIALAKKKGRKKNRGKAKVNMDGTTTIVTTKVELFPDKYQQKLLYSVFRECDKVYNYCVRKYNNYPYLFNNEFTDNKVSFFDDLYGKTDAYYEILGKKYKKNVKPVPYDILTDEIKVFYTNLESCKTNLENGNIENFKMKFKNNKYGRSIGVPKTVISKKGICYNFFGKIKGFEKINIEDIESDCKLYFDKLTKKYTLHIPILKKIKTYEKDQREEIVALDPGEKVFIAFYGLQKFGKLGIDMREKILGIQEKIKEKQKILSIGENRHGEKLRNKNKISKHIKKLYRKIKNIVTELRNQIVLYLCRNYKRILIPEFKTKKMVMNEETRKKKVKENIENIFKEHGEGSEKGREELRKYEKKRRMNKKSKFVLNMLSHFKFRQTLINKAKEFACQVEVITEEYTSMTCTKCGEKSDDYDYRNKKCSSCKYEIDRDINGARNILIKNLRLLLK